MLTRLTLLLPNLLTFCLCLTLLISCAQGKQALVHKLASNPCLDTHDLFKTRTVPKPKDCEADPPGSEGLYTLIPEYRPVEAVMVSENLYSQHDDVALVPALLGLGVDVWYLSGAESGFEKYQQTLPATLTSDSQAGILRDLRITTNSAWTRDWSPLYALSQTGKEVKLIDPYYQHGTVGKTDDMMPSQLKFELKSQKLLPDKLAIKLTKLQVILEGGNLLCNDRICFVSAKVANDNPEHMQKIATEFKENFTQSLNTVSLMPREPTGHMDLWAKFLKDDVLAISEVSPTTLNLVPPEAYGLYLELQTFLNTQATGQDKTGSPVADTVAGHLKRLDPRVKIVRIPMPLPLDLNGRAVFRSYANSLLLNGKVLLPRFRQLSLSDGNRDYPDAALIPQYEQEVEHIYRQAGYEPVWVNADHLVTYGGTWHCVAAQVPKL